MSRISTAYQPAARSDGEIREHREPGVVVADDKGTLARPQPAAVDLVLVGCAPVMRGREGDVQFAPGRFRRLRPAGGFLRRLELCVGGHLRHPGTLPVGADFGNPTLSATSA
jgi:hypothetical protein